MNDTIKTQARELQDILNQLFDKTNSLNRLTTQEIAYVFDTTEQLISLILESK